jgi:streptogramin lyase
VPAGYKENNRGAAVGPDGRLWLARLGGGLASWDPGKGSYNTIKHWSQVPTDLVDVQADPDGTVWLVNSGGALLRFDPGSGALQTWPGVGGVTRIYVDSTVSPRAVYVSMSAGVGVIRAK